MGRIGSRQAVNYATHSTTVEDGQLTMEFTGPGTLTYTAVLANGQGETSRAPLKVTVSRP